MHAVRVFTQRHLGQIILRGTKVVAIVYRYHGKLSGVKIAEQTTRFSPSKSFTELLGMRFSFPLLLCVFVAAQHLKADAESQSDPRLRLAKALFRRAREINETTQDSGRDDSKDNENELSESERQRAQEQDTSEDIFVGSGNHEFESQGKSENSDSQGEETSGDGETSSNDAEEEDNSTSGDGDEGDDDADDEMEKSDDEDETEKSDNEEDDSSIERDTSETTEEASTEDTDSSAAGYMESEKASQRSDDTSGSGSGSAELADGIRQDSDESGSAGSGLQQLVQEGSSQDESSGGELATKEDHSSKKSDIVATPSGDSDDGNESGSADVIRKGIESLSRLLKPVASGYDFELYSGNAAKSENGSEAEGESEKGQNDDSQVTHIKQCKRVCEEPMTYDQCAVPRCNLKMGTIKDLCIYLCKHQTPVCRQECE